MWCGNCCRALPLCANHPDRLAVGSRGKEVIRGDQTTEHQPAAFLCRECFDNQKRTAPAWERC
jgi:hypothetical protein